MGSPRGSEVYFSPVLCEVQQRPALKSSWH